MIRFKARKGRRKTMNENFKKLFAASETSMYKLSNDTGVPYSTINNIINGKKDINNCSTETAVRLAAGLDCTIYDIVNPINVMDGVSGKYNHVKYKWVDKNGMELHVELNGIKKTVRSKYKFQDPKSAKEYRAYTRFYINRLVEEEEFKGITEKIRGGAS